MTIRSRQTLRQFFDEGRLPTRDHFGDMIDSMLNMSDEGFHKSAENGLEVTTPAGYDALVSFYRAQNAGSPVWSVGYGGERDQLQFHHAGVTASRDQPPVLALDARDRVGIGTATPREALDVAGTVAAQGRVGTCSWPGLAPALADGEWHDLTGELTGCQAFEVMAGAGVPGGGRYALLHAVALNAFNPASSWLDFFSRKKRIRASEAWYGKRCDRLELRWEGSSGLHASYRLQVRSKCDYGAGARIQATLTRLWFDPAMDGRNSAGAPVAPVAPVRRKVHT
jgi:hypothetical protein